MAGKSIKPTRMQRSLHFAAVIAAAVAAFGCSSNPPAEQPTSSSSPDTSSSSDEAVGESGASESAESAESAPAESATPPPSGTVKRTGDTDNTIPDDYSLLNGDCDALGRKFGDLTRSDQKAQLNPKLKEAQRAQAEQSIDTVATKMEASWISGCQKSLVGKVVERKTIECALQARSVKSFDECLNGPASAPK